MPRAFFAILVFLVCFKLHAAACMVPPDGMYRNHGDAVDQAEKIFLGTVVAVHENPDHPDDDLWTRVYPYIYSFRVDECLKGRCEQIETWEGDAPVRPNRDYYSSGASIAQADHGLSKFWWSPYGRISNWPDCQLHPTFGLGNQYLVFDQLEMSLGIELITSKSDVWLGFVRSRIDDPNAEPPFPTSASSYFESAVLIAEIDQRSADTQIVVLKGDASKIEFMRGPLEHPDVSGVGECSPKSKLAEEWSSAPKHYVLVLESELLGSRQILFECERSVTRVTYSTSRSDAKRTLDEIAVQRFPIENGRVKIIGSFLRADTHFRNLSQRGLTKDTILVEDLRNFLESYQEELETEQ